MNPTLPFWIEFKGYMLGAITPAAWFAALIFAATGVAISLLIESSNRDKSKITTPDAYSLKYLLGDNVGRITLNVLLIIVFLRFTPDLIGTNLTMILALFIGAGFDRLGMLLKSKNIIDKKLPNE